MKRPNFALLLPGLLLLATPGLAQMPPEPTVMPTFTKEDTTPQVIEITADGATQAVNISARDMNLIEVPVPVSEVLTSKQIETKVMGKNIFFHYTNKTVPLELFIITDRGTYSLLLTPQTTPARRIVLRDTVVKKEEESSTLQREPYLQKLKLLMAYMVKDSDAPGYTKTTLEEPIRDQYYHGLKIRQYTGTGLRGTTYVVENTTNAILTLREADFYKPGTLAVMIDNQSLTPITPNSQVTWQSLAHIYIIEKMAH